MTKLCPHYFVSAYIFNTYRKSKCLYVFVFVLIDLLLCGKAVLPKQQLRVPAEILTPGVFMFDIVGCMLAYAIRVLLLITYFLLIVGTKRVDCTKKMNHWVTKEMFPKSGSGAVVNVQRRQPRLLCYLYLLDCFSRPLFSSLAAIEWLYLRTELLSTFCLLSAWQYLCAFLLERLNQVLNQVCIIFFDNEVYIICCLRMPF
jgi:hypothetical protein